MKARSITPKSAIALTAALVGALTLFFHGPSNELMLDVVEWAKFDKTPVIASQQHDTAVHVAGHIVTSAALRGLGSLQSMRLYTYAHDGKENVLLGMSDVNTGIWNHSRTDALNVASMYFAGGIAEGLVAKHEPDGHMDDTTNANRALAGYRGDVKNNDSYANTSEVVKDPSKACALFTDVGIAATCAEAVVHQNDEVISALADEILRHPSRFNRRHMSASELREFFAAHPVTRPLPECAFEQD